MKKVLLILCFVLVGTTLQAQSKYEKGMEKAFSLWKSGKAADAVNLFDRISKAEPKNWLPSYYAAQVNIMNGFVQKDKNKLSQQLKNAQEHLDHAKTISPKNPEIMVMQAMLHTVWVAYDGATYGMTLAPKVSKIYAEAIAIAPNNPRVVFCKADWDMGSARYFGNDTAPFCKEIDRALTLFSTFKAETSFHPSWGKERAEQLSKECKKGE